MVVSFARHRIAALRSTITKIDNRRQFFTGSYYVCWGLVLLAFTVIGARELWIGSQGNFIERGVSASTDAYLKALLMVADGSEKSVEIMSKFYGPRPLIYFSPPRYAEGDFVYDLLCYLSWPQQIRRIESDSADLREKLAMIDQGETPAVIFFSLQPPPELKRGWRFGSELWIVPIEPSP